jgi:hypothetical protein
LSEQEKLVPEVDPPMHSKSVLGDSEVQSEDFSSEQVEKKTGSSQEIEPELEKKSSEQVPKVKEYNGLMGRKHTSDQINEILDWYLIDGTLPDYVTDRQLYSYKHHPGLGDRRKLLERDGILKKSSGTKKNRANVLSVERAKSQRKRRKSVDI